MGKGATFTVELPIVQEAFLREEVEPHARKRILVIDDEEEVLRLIIRILEGMRHQVVALARGETTLDKMDKEEYDLIISDVRMPGMGGQELHQQIPKRLPKLAECMIFTTGDTVSDSTRAFLQNVGTPYVTKPFPIEDWGQAIDEVLKREKRSP